MPYAAKQIILHPGGLPRYHRPPEVDLALIEFTEPVEDIAPIRIYRGDRELNMTLFIVGYGDYGTPGSGLSRLMDVGVPLPMSLSTPDRNGYS